MTLRFATMLFVLLEARAHAGPNAEALYDEGQRAYDHAAYATAIAKWKQSFELSREPELLFNLAQAYRLGGDCTEALATYKRFLQSDSASDQSALAEELVQELAPKCGKPSTSERPARQPSLAGLVIGGGGVALLATGLLFGHHASILGDEVSHACAQRCDWALQKDNDARGRHFATAGYVLDAVGIAGLVGGATMLYLGHRDSFSVTPQPAERGALLSWTGSW